MYNDNERALIWLNNFVNISTKKKLALLDLFDSPYEMFEFYYGKEILDLLGIHKIPANEIILKPELLKHR